MYFKQIEMTGFKSFADRTVVDMEPGMTSIVGPNGCGKSNILDAIRWVLGEQRAKSLRGAHMQDVIFNGSEERAATGMAEVTMTFDNSDNRLPVDFSEVQITRRVYRSGESEYLINKSLCRLKDVQELFMDTGIGTNAYSMIGQGMISMVLSSKPEDRRYLFEEAAGIIKYKSRKRVAMRKLDQAEQNLLRLGDIIAEIQRQSRSLKRQVNAAIRYRELKDELRGLEIRAAWLRHVFLEARIAGLKEKFAVAQASFEQDSARTSTLEARYEELSLARLEIDRVLHARREGVHELDTEMEKIERQIALIRQQLDFCREQQRRAAEERETFKEQAAAIEAQRTGTTEQAQAMRLQLEEAQAALAAKQAEHDAAAHAVTAAEEQLELARKRLVETMGLRAKAQTALETLSVNIGNVDGQLELIFERQTVENRRAEEVIAFLEERQKIETEKQAALGAVEDNLRRVQEDLAARTAGMNTLNEKWQQLRETRSSVNARLTSLRELRDSYEGFATGVRAIMLAKQKNVGPAEGIIGPVGDLVSTEKKFERAVEAALGGNVNNIVVERAEAAKAAIAFLKEHKAGRVTFLPLDTIRPNDRDDLDRVLGQRGVIGAMLDFVQYDGSVDRAMQYVFHNTAVVETIDDAIRIARGGGRCPRLVTLDGEVVSSAGAVTGGRTHHDQGGLIGRSAEIADLEGRLDKTDNEIRRVTAAALQAQQAIEALKGQAGTLAAEQNALRKVVNELGVEIARLSTELKSLSQGSDSLNREREDLYSRRETFEAERRAANERALTMESEDEQLQAAMANAQDTAAQARNTQALIAQALGDMRLNLASVTQALEQIDRDQIRQARDLQNALSETERREKALEELAGQEHILNESAKDQIERAKALSEGKEEARKTVVEAENRRQALLDESEDLEKELKVLRDRSRESQAAVHKLEIDLRHDEDQLGFFQERILSEYNVALSQLTQEQAGADEHDDATRERLVKEIRAKIERMGTVNLMAIEEYQALCERNDFLVSQEQDLSKAKEALLNVIKRIDVTIQDMFLETFNTVAENFRQYFRRLFNGGHARIYLLDEADPLECGIEIEARPPGKKPQLISLLSGGEQAMTAIGLLFSIFKAKPSPFCVLDEVDAPLDDANIGRFLNMLDEFATDTQFIVITHNKQTMARAGALYGVTQQERGVSQLVSVKFDEVPDSAHSAA